MYQIPLPDFYERLEGQGLHDFIAQKKSQLKDDLIILGHHYQRDEVICHADVTGDSLKLARAAAKVSDKRWVVFCGVHFMAETADILTSDVQQVALPDMRAGCDMADMAQARDVKRAWNEAVAAGLKDIIPITYVNSTAALKAFVGDHGGIVCTSGNAEQAIAWARARGKHVFFFPDQHLGRNISKRMGLDPERDMVLWEPEKVLGGVSPELLQETSVWLWRGHCPVHAMFTLKQIAQVRTAYPQMKIMVHPECAMEVVDAADMIGSTEQIIAKIAASPVGSEWAVGTEKHLVERLAAQFPDRKIVSLNPYTCLCGTMNRISGKHLAWVLGEIADRGEMPNIIRVEPEVAASAKLALDRMLELH